MLVNAIEVKDLWAEKVRPFFTAVTSFIPCGSAGAKIQWRGSYLKVDRAACRDNI